MQHLLERAVWDADGVCDDASQDYVIEHLGDPGAVLVVDETGDVKTLALEGIRSVPSLSVRPVQGSWPESDQTEACEYCRNGDAQACSP